MTNATPAAPGERNFAPFRSVECSHNDKRDWLCVPATSLTEARANAADARKEPSCFRTLIQKLNRLGRYVTIEATNARHTKASR